MHTISHSLFITVSTSTTNTSSNTVEIPSARLILLVSLQIERLWTIQTVCKLQNMKLYTTVLREGDPWPLEQSFHGTQTMASILLKEVDPLPSGQGFQGNQRGDYMLLREGGSVILRAKITCIKYRLQDIDQKLQTMDYK